MNTSRRSLAGSISDKLRATCTPGISVRERLNTIVLRLGSGLPTDSNVFRPMTKICPVVNCLNHLSSSGRCQGMRLRQPMTRFSDMAAMALKRFTVVNVTHRTGPVKRPGNRAPVQARITPAQPLPLKPNAWFQEIGGTKQPGRPGDVWRTENERPDPSSVRLRR